MYTLYMNLREENIMNMNLSKRAHAVKALDRLQAGLGRIKPASLDIEDIVLINYLADKIEHIEIKAVSWKPR